MGSNLKKEAMERVGEVEHAECYYDTDRNMPLPGASSSSTLVTIIAAKAGEIGALTAEVTHLAEKLAERDAQAGSVGDDPVFRDILAGWLGADGEVYKRLVAYLDSRSSSTPSMLRNSALESAARASIEALGGSVEEIIAFTSDASAPSVDRNSVLEEVADQVAQFDKRATPKGIAVAIRCMKKAAPQPVDAAQAVSEREKRLEKAAQFALDYENDDPKAIAEIELALANAPAGIQGQEFACCYLARMLRDALAPSPAAQPDPTTLAQQIAAAQAVVASWSPATRAAVQLEGAAAQGPVREWRSVLEELVVLIDDHLNGEYEIDSFTAQPARTLLAQPTDTTVDEKCTFCGAPWGRYGCTCPKPTDTTKGA